MKPNKGRSGVAQLRPPVKPRSCLSTKVVAFFRNCILLLLLISSFSVEAQSLPVTGKVTADDGKGLAGVTVSIKGNNSRTIVTDANGTFSVTVPTGKETLVFTYVGFTDQEVS